MSSITFSPPKLKPVLAAFSQRLQAHSVWAVTALGFLLFFYRLGSWAFFDADEGRYGSIPREMIVNGDWITPTLNQIKFFDKPPLLYWGIATSYHVFGFNEFAARLIPALAAALGVLMAWALGRRMFGTRVGRWSALILSTSLLWPVLARVVITDMLVSSLVFTALALWWLGHSEVKQQRQNYFFLGFWITLALAVLAKGPLAVVLVLGTLVSYGVMTRQWSLLREMRLVPGLLLFICIAAPWFVLVSLRNTGFNHYFWYDQHIARFFGESISGQDHVTGGDYYLKLLPVMLFPWSFFLPAAMPAAWRALRSAHSPHRHAGVFLLCGIGFITLFFSASSSKLITYLLPTLPMTAILLALYFDRMLAKPHLKQRLLWSGASLLAGVLLIGAMAGGWRGAREILQLNGSEAATYAACTLLTLWSGVLCFVIGKRNVRLLMVSTACGFTAVFVAGLFVVSSIAPQFTTPSLLAYIRPGIDAGAEVDTLPFTQSVGFYAQKRVEILGLPSELTFGVDQLPVVGRGDWVTDEKFGETRLQHLQRDLHLKTPVYFLIRKSRKTAKMLSKIAAPPYNLPVKIIIENQRFLVIGNAEALKLTPPRLTDSNFSNTYRQRPHA